MSKSESMCPEPYLGLQLDYSNPSSWEILHFLSRTVVRELDLKWNIQHMSQCSYGRAASLFAEARGWLPVAFSLLFIWNAKLQRKVERVRKRSFIYNLTPHIAAMARAMPAWSQEPLCISHMGIYVQGFELSSLAFPGQGRNLYGKWSTQDRNCTHMGSLAHIATVQFRNTNSLKRKQK